MNIILSNPKISVFYKLIEATIWCLRVKKEYVGLKKGVGSS